MPKDWKYHKAEVERLYIKEGKPLEQIRDILREEHGFNASMRAYRMRIDSWGLDQNKSSRESHSSRRISPQPSSSSGLVSKSNSTTPLGGRRTEEDLELSTQQNTPNPVRKERGPFDVISAFETLLSKWEPRTESALLCFQHPDFDEWVKRSNDSNGPILFKLIEALVPPEEQLVLYKSFLEADLAAQSDPDYPFTAWRCAWDLILRCDDLEEDDDECEVTYCSEDWERAKELLREDGVISQVAGQAFLDSALVVIAERRLEVCKKDPHHWNRRKYLDILKDFRHSDVDVDPSFYKHSLQIIEVEELENSQQSLRKRADLTRLVDSRRRCMNDEEKEVFKGLQKQYMGILKAFYDRDMKVDQTWTYYLMNVL
ncbi:Clr5 domain-containing protein [Cadophora sp. MPI-SDFR-AT-0126]|nr:Clr5 domain-containing protein [Leotiomycetes sp. MPI-SDFR-AT-0126]